jgi:hypothetical protein
MVGFQVSSFNVYGAVLFLFRASQRKGSKTLWFQNPAADSRE